MAKNWFFQAPKYQILPFSTLYKKQDEIHTLPAYTFLSLLAIDAKNQNYQGKLIRFGGIWKYLLKFLYSLYIKGLFSMKYTDNKQND